MPWEGQGALAYGKKDYHLPNENRCIMRKEFNVTGSCNPEWHYMVNTEKRFKAVESLIDRGNYFTINRVWQ